MCFTSEIIERPKYQQLKSLPLPYRLEEEDGGADGNVERVETAEHGYADVGIGGLAPLLGKSCGFRSHDYRSRTAHIYIIIKV